MTSKIVYINKEDIINLRDSVKTEKAQKDVIELLKANLDNSLILVGHTWFPDIFATLIDTLKLERAERYKNVLFFQALEPIYFDNKKLEELKKIFPNIIFIVPFNKNISNLFKTVNFDLFIYLAQDYNLNTIARTFEKKYCCFNFKPKHHRIRTLYELYKNDLLEQGYITARLFGKDIKSIYTKEFTDKNFVKKFPFVLDVTTQQEVNKYFTDLSTYFYKAPINLVTETHANIDQLFITEKTIKAILAKQFTFLVGNKYSYSYLEKTYGLKNFDFLNTDNLSYEKAISVYTYFLKKYSLSDIKDMYSLKLDTLHYNFEVLQKSKEIAMVNFEKSFNAVL